MKTTSIIKLTPIALACAVAMSPVHAEDVMKVYGQANVSLDSSSVNYVKSGVDQTTMVGREEGTSVMSNASRLGMMGSLDTTIGNTSLIYQLEAEYKTTGVNGDTASEANTIYVREAYAGLKSKDYGQIRLGRLTVGYKSSYTAIDPWTDHVLQARQSGQQGASSINSNYFNNAVEYVSPTFSGIQLNANYSTLSKNDAGESLHNSGKLVGFLGGTTSGFGAKYNNGGLRLTADVLSFDADSVTGGVANGQAKQATAQYKFASGTTLAGLYEDVSELNLGTNTFAIVTQKVGKNGLLTASYGVNQGDNTSVYGTEDGTTIGLGAKYKLTAKSALIAGWSQHERDGNDASTFTVGIDAKFGY